MPAQIPWSHFHVAATGRVTGFNLDTCETCGGPIQEPNAINLHETPGRLQTLGLVQVVDLPPETYHDEATGMDVCDGCSMDRAHP